MEQSSSNGPRARLRLGPCGAIERRLKPITSATAPEDVKNVAAVDPRMIRAMRPLSAPKRSGRFTVFAESDF